MSNEQERIDAAFEVEWKKAMGDNFLQKDEGQYTSDCTYDNHVWFTRGFQARAALQQASSINFHAIKQALAETYIEDGQISRDNPPEPYATALTELLPDASIDKLVEAVIKVLATQQASNRRPAARYNAVCIQLVPALDGYATMTHVECVDAAMQEILTDYAKEVIKVLPQPPQQQEGGI